VVFRQDDAGTALFIIESGRVKISRQAEDGREITLNVLYSGDYFGELALLDDEPRSADAVAVEATSTWLLPSSAFHDVLSRNPRMARQMLSTMSRRYVRRLTDAVQDAVFLDVQTRLARAILQLHDGHHSPGGDGRIRATQTDLASMIGATRESVNKWLGYFERQGWVKRSRGSLQILDPLALREAGDRLPH
jgi:CRP-like cAMP-binding protein